MAQKIDSLGLVKCVHCKGYFTPEEVNDDVCIYCEEKLKENKNSGKS